MATHLLPALALVFALVTALVEGKITCKGKEPQYQQEVAKFAGCAAYINDHCKAARCIIEAVKKPPSMKAVEDYLISAVPEKSKKFFTAEMKKCESKFGSCKSLKDDPTGKSCCPLKTCMMAIKMGKLCE